jgi:putative inorganic carbon (HCO3(-)) transporter
LTPSTLQRLARNDWVVLVILLPVFVYADRIPLAIVGLAALVVAVTWAVRWLAHEPLWINTPLDLPIVCLLLVVPLSLYASVNLRESLVPLVGLLYGIAVFGSAVRTSARGKLVPWPLGIWLLSGVGIALVALASVDWVSVKFPLLTPLTSRLPRLLSGVGSRAGQGLNPNVVGGTLALFVPPLLGIWLYWPRARGANEQPERRWAWLDFSQWPGRAVWLGGFVVIGLLLLLTQSRSALLGTVLASALLLAMRSRVLRWLALVAAVAGLAAVVTIGPGVLADSLLGSGGPSASAGSLNFAERQEVWSRALYAIQDFPFTGVGLGQFETVARLLYPFFLAGPESSVPLAHDIYLQVAVEFGLGGLVAYSALLVATFVVVLRAYRRAAQPRRLLILGLGGGLLAYQIFGISDAIPLGGRPSFEWWLVLGMLHGLAQEVAEVAAPAGISARRRWGPVLERFGLWFLGSLIAISFVGENALLGVGIAVAVGAVLGVSVVRQAFTLNSLPQASSEPSST